MGNDIAGRSYARVYDVTRRGRLHEKLREAVEASGGQLIYASREDRAPVYLGVQTARRERIGILVYPFNSNIKVTRNRPTDEHRVMIRYGGKAVWKSRPHSLGRDVANIDSTVVLGVHETANLFVGLDPEIYDPLPMTNSIEFKQQHVDALENSASGWHVFDRNRRPGRRRGEITDNRPVETIVLFRPHRFLDYVRLERTAGDLGLDPSLRYAVAMETGLTSATSTEVSAITHSLESQFAMTSNEILEMISQRNRLTVAVRGGVAEHHLRRVLTEEPGVANVVSLDKDGQHDFDVTMDDGKLVGVECKNCSPQGYANGDFKVEVQKTRATQGDPSGRLYRPGQFDVLAACLYGPTREWRFAYRLTDRMERHPKYPDRLAPLHHVTTDWAQTLREAL